MSVYTGVTHSRLKAISLEADEATITRLNVTDSVLSARVRFTIAEVNAGATLVAAITGKSIRMVNCKAIAVGGAAGAVTTVDVLGTVSTARKLVAFAQANLTQSTVLTAGGTGAAVLADGASYTANDVSTGITVNKTGSSVTTATHIDVIFDYVVV
jgi:hypothetical protein